MKKKRLQIFVFHAGLFRMHHSKIACIFLAKMLTRKAELTAINTKQNSKINSASL